MKRRTLVFVLTLLGLLLLIVLIGPTTLLPLLKPDLIVIELERTGCYGICPIYDVRILGNGQVHYEGRNFVLVEGVQATRISTTQVQDLVTAFENIHFSALPDQLSYGIEDLAESRTCLTLWGTRKCVDIRSSPAAAAGRTELEKVKELNSVIDGTAQVEQWVGTREQIIEQMQQSK